MTSTDEAKKLVAEAQENFTQYFCENYPGPKTIITDPKWHAPKIFRAATRDLESLVSRLLADKERLTTLLELIPNQKTKNKERSCEK